jgi:hypothetical protein
MTKSSQDLYKYHVANVRRVGRALDRIALTLRSAIAKEDSQSIITFLPLYMLLLGAWAESRLRKLLYEPNAFSINERKIIDSQRTHLDKWQKVAEMVFRRHYSVPHAPLSSITLPFSAATKYKEINELLEKELKVIIEVRNKLAHGQWEYPLTNTGDDISAELMKLIKAENLLSLQFKKSLISSILDIVNDLAVSQPTFDRDFDTHYRHIVETRRNLKNRSYTKYVDALIAKRKRGLKKRTSP